MQWIKKTKSFAEVKAEQAAKRAAKGKEPVKTFAEIKEHSREVKARKAIREGEAKNHKALLKAAKKGDAAAIAQLQES